jgi:hypothetical protein
MEDDTFKRILRALTTLKSEGEVTSLSGVDKREVRDNREKSKYFSNCTTFNTNKQKTNTRTYVNQRDDMLTKTRY